MAGIPTNAGSAALTFSVYSNEDVFVLGEQTTKGVVFHDIPSNLLDTFSPRSKPSVYES